MEGGLEQSGPPFHLRADPATMDQRLAGTLDILSTLAAELRGPWWVIGSTAAVLVGAHNEVADVDLLTSECDARMLLKEQSSEPPLPSPLFHSSVFGRLSIAPLPVEIMAGLKVRGELLVPRSRVGISWRKKALYVPSVEEQIEILQLFGRAKDLRRAERLRLLLDDPRGSL